jgi:hypothetical protein
MRRSGFWLWLILYVLLTAGAIAVGITEAYVLWHFIDKYW